MFMEAMARSQGKTRWMEKTPTHVHYLGVLASAFPTARFLHVVRDGRAVAASAVQLGWTPRLPGGRVMRLIWAAKRWQYLTDLGTGFGTRHPSRALEITYEDLVLRPEDVLPRIADFVGVRLDPGQVEASRLGSLGRPNSAFAAGPASPGLDRWRLEWSAAEADAVSRSVARSLRRYGYALDPVSRVSPRLRATHALGTALAGVHVRVKEWAKRIPVAGRLAASPLEFTD
jgi:hypothetical protein